MAFAYPSWPQEPATNPGLRRMTAGGCRIYLSDVASGDVASLVGRLRATGLWLS